MLFPIEHPKCLSAVRFPSRLCFYLQINHLLVIRDMALRQGFSLEYQVYTTEGWGLGELRRIGLCKVVKLEEAKG